MYKAQEHTDLWILAFPSSGLVCQYWLDKMESYAFIYKYVDNIDSHDKWQCVKWAMVCRKRKRDGEL